MIHFFDNRLFFRRSIIEFATESDIPSFSAEKCDVLLAFNMFVDPERAGFECVPTWMLKYSTINSEPELFGLQDKTIRNSFSYCQRKGYQYVFLQGKEIEMAHLKAFKKMCDQMYKIRGLKTRVNVRILKEYAQHSNLALSYAKKGDEIYCYHVYAVDGIHTRCWYSCSLIHTNGDDNLLSKIKRFNRYNDIKTFYNLDYDTYDFGGVNSFSKPDGRAKYKMTFHGEPSILSQKTFDLSRKANLYRKMVAIFHRLRG